MAWFSQGDGLLADRILHALPAWFGIDEARAAYVAHAKQNPMIVASDGGQPVGYMSLTRHTDAHWEIHSMGVLPAHHRHGAGRAMVAEAEQSLAAKRVKYLSVKTLSAAHPDPNYARTRAFYKAVGFVPFEEVPTLWGPDLPCLVMLRPLVADA